ncbi:hypothetical protein [Bacillus altitudinis]|uniref:hypothetical protein n=1 Tax=Bacillus altitudinis TaxID=293387 RepID=UPI001643B316|nr:hypothetical protein [Bacillus altitudinis]
MREMRKVLFGGIKVKMRMRVGRRRMKVGKEMLFKKNVGKIGMRREMIGKGNRTNKRKRGMLISGLKEMKYLDKKI